MKAWEHLKTITHHRNLVMLHCFKVGLYRQGLLHDLSKYSPTEFLVGAKYWSGKESPNNGERRDKGLSTSWLHHKGRNKHHLEYWIDYAMREGDPICGMKMPVKYVVEMFIDRVCACKNYQGEDYKDDSAWKYYERGKGKMMLHPETQALLEKLLKMLACKGEDYTFRYIKYKLLKNNH